MDANQISSKILETATRFLGLWEKVNNKIWDNPDTPGHDPEADELLGLLRLIGWQPGWAYCACFAGGVWLRSYQELNAPSDLLKKLKGLSPSCMTTLHNFESLIVPVPAPGAIVLWQLGKTTQGHAGIVTKASTISRSLPFAQDPNLRDVTQVFSTLEGNTGQGAGDTRHDYEGDGIFRRVRSLNFTPKSDGLWLRGFLHPFTWSPAAPLRQAVVVSKGLNVRSGPGVENEVLGVLKQGVTISLLSGVFPQASGDWWEVRYESKSGWVSSRHLKLL